MKNPFKPKVIHQLKAGLWVALLIASQSLSHNSFASPLKTRCGKQTTNRISWSYCISQARGSKNPDILYYFHGIGGSAKEWESISGQVREEWQKTQKDPPTVVSLSFGKVWLLAPLESRIPPGALMEILFTDVLSKLETELGGLHGKRMLVGLSMGGFNATESYLWEPQLFDRVALLCPALSTFSPFISDRQLQREIRKLHANPIKATEARDLARDFFHDEAHWDKISPQEVGPSLIHSNSPPLFVSIGKQDDYGFFEGAKAFADLARSKGVQKVEWAPVNGLHCSFDSISLAKFLTE